MTTAYDPSDAVIHGRWAPGDDTVLFHACRTGNAGAVGGFLQSGHGTEGFDERGFRPLHVAAAAGHVDVVRRLLDAGANVNATSAHSGCYSGCRPLHAAVSGDHLAVVDLLLQRGAKIDATDETGFTPLHLAAARSTLAVVRRLLVAGADPSREVADTAPVVLALRRGHRSIAALLRQCARMPTLTVD